MTKTGSRKKILGKMIVLFGTKMCEEKWQRAAHETASSAERSPLSPVTLFVCSPASRTCSGVPPFLPRALLSGDRAIGGSDVIAHSPQIQMSAAPRKVGPKKCAPSNQFFQLTIQLRLSPNKRASLRFGGCRSKYCAGVRCPRLLHNW